MFMYMGKWNSDINDIDYELIINMWLFIQIVRYEKWWIVCLWLYLLKVKVTLKVLKILTCHTFHFVFVLKFTMIVCYTKTYDVGDDRTPQ